MRLLAPLAVAAVLAQDPRALVEQSLQRNARNEDLARQYTYLETVTEREWKDGKVSKVTVDTFDVVDVYGQPHRRLIRKNGQPLSPEESRKEQRKIDKLAAERAKESPADREKRIVKYREDRRRQRDFFQEIPRAYDFKLAGSTRVNGADAWIVDATPRPGFKPISPRAAMLAKFKGRFFFSKATSTMLRLEADAIDSVSFGWVIARLDRGARFQMETSHINGELWMPTTIKVDFDARVALLKKLRVDMKIEYSDFRKFRTDSKLLPATESQ